MTAATDGATSCLYRNNHLISGKFFKKKVYYYELHISSRTYFCDVHTRLKKKAKKRKATEYRT